MELSTPIEQIPRIGPIILRRLKNLGIRDVRDLIFHFPHRYEDFSNIIPIRQIKLNEICCIAGKILEMENTKTWKKRMMLTTALVSDQTGAIRVVWFNQPYLIKILKPGDRVSLAGKILLSDKGLYLANPIFEKINGEEEIFGRQLIHTGRIVPVYPETEGLSSKWLRSVIRPVLAQIKTTILDPLPEKIRREHGLLPINLAIWQIHFPDSMILAKKAKERFSFEELFFIALFTLRMRIKMLRCSAPAIPINLTLIQKFVKTLPFKLTDAQRKSAWQILKDLEKGRPMNRLLEGDVGSGKTIVAAMAALNVCRAGYQTALMAPTEILAKQHFQSISKIMQGFKISIGLLTGKEDKFSSPKLKNQTIEISRQKLIEKAAKGEINLLIGTHALIQDRVKFGCLGLVILDEQHRFGVEQRSKLLRRSKNSKDQKLIPHLLSMTATPIPRTLALTLYGDLDLSLINELPRGRKKIITQIVAPQDRKQTYNFIRKEIKKGRQVFVICPRIEPAKASLKATRQKRKSETLNWTEAKAVKEEYKKLSQEVFPDLKVGMLHGQMPTREKEKIMKDFRNKKIDILVSTSVIEVGIDVPNASCMMIEGAERFGLAQLHQFRGRVGRARFQSFCFPFTDSPAAKTRQRLEALVRCEDGFALAEKDLKIRGPGDFAGTRQWGIPDLIMGSLTDLVLVEKTRQTAKEILEQDPLLKQYPLLKEGLKKFEGRVHLE